MKFIESNIQITAFHLKHHISSLQRQRGICQALPLLADHTFMKQFF